ncbi:MAG: leucyl/phenylalanyl-tRNA--protein transferase [Spirochaetes bacterium ADurb.Bin133]|jgi:leucyl/phenylalanyl-tRNA--protein transferase|nr:MAG: leucyl/phenylalanyl-tRNA--protein transferase [Spirochaetes bacterium ADurb.Bin133]
MGRLLLIIFLVKFKTNRYNLLAFSNKVFLTIRKIRLTSEELLKFLISSNHDIAKLIPERGMDYEDLCSLYILDCSPVINSIDEIKLIPKKLANVAESEYCVTNDFSPAIIEECCSYGFFPMALKLWNSHFLTVKYHLYKSIVEFDTLHIPKSVRRYAKNMRLTFDKNFDLCIDNIHRIYGLNWLYPPLVEGLRALHLGKTFKIGVHSVELWEGDELIAGEIGFIVRNVYTSLSGFYLKNCAGNIQMSALGLFLKANGFAYWDLGMPLPYKRKYGAVNMNRVEYEKLFDKTPLDLLKFPSDEIDIESFFC